MVVRELLVKLGVTDENSSFFKALVGVEALKAGLGTLISKVQEFRNWMVQGTVDAGYEAQLYASRLGLTVDQTQRLAYVSRMANVTLEEMTHATRALAAKGITDIHGALLNLSDTFARMPDNGRKLALAQEYLGRYGTKFIPVLNQGRAAMEAFMKEADDLGVVMSGPAIEATRKYGVEQRRLQASLEGLRNTAMIPLLPILTESLEKWTKIVHQLKDFISNVKEMRARLQTLAIMLGTAALAWGVYTFWTTAATVATIMETSMLGAMATMLWGVTQAVWSAVWPWLAWVAGIATAYLAIDDLVVFLEGGDSLIGRALKKWIGPFDDWHDAVHKVVEKIKAEIRSVFGWGPESTTVGRLVPESEIGRAQGPQGFMRKLRDWLNPEVLAFPGGAASPHAAATLALREVHTGNVTVNLTVHGATGSPADTGAAVHDAVDKVMKRHFRGAAAAAAGP